MRPAHPLERPVGIEWYVSDADGVGGRLRDQPADFRVREIEQFGVQPVAADPGAYPHLVIRATLREWDTNAFASALTDAVGISRERVSWAGTKDKHAVTTQLFSVAGLTPEELPDLRDVEVEVLGRAGRPVLFGDLAGNAFSVTVRDPVAPENVTPVTAALARFGAPEDQSQSDRGDDGIAVPNYFGPQRFGALRPVTHEVGLAVVRGNWETAVMTYLGATTDREPEATRGARKVVRETRDWEAALEAYPGSLRYERAMLHSLVETGGDTTDDFRAALETLPSNLQTLLVNAAQSYAFNLIVSRRLDRGLPFGRAVAGDVVCFADSDTAGGILRPDPERTQRVSPERVDAVNRHCRRGRAFVTAPLVGTETTLGDGVPGEIERAVLDTIGIDPADFDGAGEFGSTGTRRAILFRTGVDVTRNPLQFSFQLPKGSYATVLLREYLKTSPAVL